MNEVWPNHRTKVTIIAPFNTSALTSQIKPISTSSSRHYQANYIGESEASQIISTQTVGEEPSPPPTQTFIRVNSSLAILLLDQWQHSSCPILYFVIEYKLAGDLPWTVGNIVLYSTLLY